MPFMDYICGETADAWLEEQYGRLSEGDDSTAELVGLIAAAAWPEGDILSEENSGWAAGYLSAAVLTPLRAPPVTLIVAASERSGIGADSRKVERLATALTARLGELGVGYREAIFVAGMFAGLDERELRAWARRVLRWAWGSWTPSGRRRRLLRKNAGRSPRLPPWRKAGVWM